MTSTPANIALTSDNGSAHHAPANNVPPHNAPAPNAPAPNAPALDVCHSVGPDEVVRQRKRGAELEDAIRSACLAELAEVGYGSLTIESVATRAQTGKASIYRRWPTKQDLVRDSVGCLLAGPLMRLSERALNDSITTRDALLNLLMQVSEILAGPQGDAMRSVMSESLRDRTFASSFECEFYDPRKVALINLLERGVARGEVRADAVDDLVVEMIAGGLIHRVLLRRARTAKADLERIVDSFLMPAISPR
jgi:AcrR family transcriptional regulator